MKPTKKKTAQKLGKKAKIIEKDSSKDLLTSVDIFFDKKLNIFYFISLALTVVFAAMLFDVRVSLTGDDAMYIIRASDFANDFKYPDFQGPLYPIVLGPLVLMFGINVIALKMLSFIFILAQITFFYFAFRKNIPSSLLAIAMILSSINAYFLYFASQTYSEAFFMALQALMFLVFFKYFISAKEIKVNIKTDYKQYLLLGFLLLLMSLTRSIGYAALAVIVIYFIFEKKWMQIVYSVASFFLFLFSFKGLKALLWSKTDAQFETQANSLLLKNYYNAAEGKEDFMGFLMRIVDNSQMYFSKHLYMMFGLRPDLAIQDNITWLTILTYVILIAALVLVFRKNKQLLFTGIYITVMIGATFILMQKTWDQGRFITVYLPFIILMIFSAFYYLSKLKKLKFLQFVPYLLAVVLLFTSFGRTIEKTKVTRKVLDKNMNGNMLYGFSPDWTHYLQMSQWVAENLDDTVVVACRKPSISFVYGGGRQFAGIFRVKTQNLDTVLTNLSSTETQTVAINMKEMEQKGVPVAVISALKIMNSSFVNGVKTDKNGKDIEYYLYGLYRIPWTSVEGIFEMLTEYGVNYSVNAEVLTQIRENVKDGEKVNLSVVSPDDLLNDLKRKNVKYVILANLRKNTNNKNGYTINTIYRYLYFIQLKYPTAFRVVNTIGNQDDEPAQLVEILYNN